MPFALPRPSRRSPLSTSTRAAGLLAAAALLAACGTDDGGTDDDAAAPPADEQPDADTDADADGEGDTPDGGEDQLDQGDLEDLLGDQEQPDLPDPNDQVEDGVFRGVGVVMPAPDGWEIDPMFLAQGTVVAMTADGLQTLAAQAVDTTALPEEEELDLDTLLEGEREGLGGDPSVDEEIDFDGAERAHLLRFDDLPAQQEGAPVNSLLTVIADDGDGQLAMFNYLAPTDDYDDETEQLLLTQGGFDPESEPLDPMTGVG